VLRAKVFCHDSGIVSLVEFIVTKPMEKVFTGFELARVIRATTVEESMPPLSNAPRGTSEINRIFTASASRRSNSSRHSSSLPG